jgi:hypothetical protein
MMIDYDRVEWKGEATGRQWWKHRARYDEDGLDIDIASSEVVGSRREPRVSISPL